MHLASESAQSRRTARPVWCGPFLFLPPVFPRSRANSSRWALAPDQQVSYIESVCCARGQLTFGPTQSKSRLGTALLKCLNGPFAFLDHRGRSPCFLAPDNLSTLSGRWVVTITFLPMTTLVIVAISIVVAVSVYYGLTGSSSTGGRKRRARRRKDRRSAAEESRKADAERTSSDENADSTPHDDALRNWADSDQESKG